MKENTFGEYPFPDWVPENTRRSIKEFWGCFGRTYRDWFEDHKPMDRCSHGPGPHGFGEPPYGSLCEYILPDREILKKQDVERYKIVKGRYIHHWNNIGSIVDEYGESHHVSSCDRWVRIYE